MSRRSINSPYGSNDILVDARIGDAYRHVEALVQHLAEVIYVAKNLDKLVAHQVEFNTDTEREVIEWRYDIEGRDEPWKLLITFTDLMGISPTSFRDEMTSILQSATDVGVEIDTVAQEVFNARTTAVNAANTANDSTADAQQAKEAAESANAAAQQANAAAQAAAVSAERPIVQWHRQDIENSLTIPADVNAFSFGPVVSITSGQSVTVGDGSFWTIANGEGESGSTDEPFDGNYDYGGLQ